jgi:hypothetical protein
MNNLVSRRNLSRAALTLAAALLVTVGLVASASAGGSAFTVTKLVSDQAGVALVTDPSLVNAWGLTSLPTSPWWVSDNGTNVSTLYLADGTKVPLTVSVPNAPTGAVSNTGSSFAVTNGTTSAPALFIFATEEGAILGWNKNVAATTPRWRCRPRTAPSSRAWRVRRPRTATACTRPTSTTAASMSSTGASRT